MKTKAVAALVCALALSAVSSSVRGDLLLLSNGRVAEGKIESVSDQDVVFKVDGENEGRRVERSSIRKIVYCDENGAVVPGPGAAPSTQPAEARWTVPSEPVAPPVIEPVKDATTYYLIPLHGEVGSTILASALEKSLADAVLRKPSVIILDIDSPGGLVNESLKIMKVIAHYNKHARIVAFVEQDLSAAAIFTLSVKEIYVKQLSTIGAATSFIPGQPGLSEKVEEKMQSAWRAAARNSAEEGGHEPMLADAMIDNDQDLHIEDANGKPVIKEGDGPHMLVRKGKVLTLTSHEAVACGLAAGEADDLDELGKTMGFKSWSECKGLAADLAAYLPKQNQAFEETIKKLDTEFGLNLQTAIEADPDGNQQFVEVQRVVPGPAYRGPAYRGPVMPGRPYVPVPGRPGVMMPQNQIVERRIVATVNPQEWKPRSLACVVALQSAESSLDDMAQVCTLFGHEGAAEPLNNLKAKLAAIREKTFKERNKYQAVPSQPVASVPQPGVNPSPNAPQTSVTKPRSTVQPLIALTADASAKAPAPADSDDKLKKIAAGWQDQNGKASALLGDVIGLSATHAGDETVHISNGGVIATPIYYSPTVTFRVVLMTSDKQVRINCGGSAIFFNSTMHPGELRLYIGPANNQHKPGAGTLPKDQWVGMEFTVTPEEMVIYVDGAERYRFKGDYSKIHQQFAVRGDSGDVWVKSLEVITDKPQQ